MFGALAAVISLVTWVVALAGGAIADASESADQKLAAFRSRVNHIIVIYQENWSFDGLYGKFPGANGLAQAGESVKQVNLKGEPYKALPQPVNAETAKPDPRFPADLPVAPFDLAKYVSPDDKTGDLVHRFYREQLQIDDGKMDKFVAWSDASGLVMSYYDASDMPEGKLAKRYTLCDNFFHAAFGGSFLNHIWLVAAASPRFEDAPESMIIHDPERREKYDELQVTTDGYAVNTVFSVNLPHQRDPKGNDLFLRTPRRLLPSLTMPTIGDRLDAKGVTWSWYSGGWDRAMAGATDPEFNKYFQFHHQPFVYFANYADGTPAKALHLKDEGDFFDALVESDKLPAVAFIKPFGEDNEHPGYTKLIRGQRHVARLVKAIRDSSYWKDSLIVITYDEHGGRWDHVPPPRIDRWGPGSRVPTIVIGRSARRGYVDHTEYDTTSILKLIERRFDLAPLTDRDRKAGDLLNALDFE
jgi:phospholipase C